MKANPPWVTDVLADYWDILQDKAPAEWLPKLEHVRPVRSGKAISAHLHELGCGAYGCVLPTGDDRVVLKVTTDVSEARFAIELAEKLSAPVCVRYFLVIELSEKHEGRPLHLLWRESADFVGKAEEGIGAGADHDIDQQAILAGAAFDGIWNHLPVDEVKKRITAWTRYLEIYQGHRQLMDLFKGMAKVYREQHILFGDVHSGNVGQVDGTWTIVDPGNIAIVPDSYR